LTCLAGEQEQSLLALTTQEPFDAGPAILSEGEERDALFFVKNGSVRVHPEHPEF